MNKTIQDVIRYVEEVTGATLRLKPDPEVLQAFPAYFGALYEACRVEILDHNYLLLLFKEGEIPAPAEIAGHYRVASRQSKEPVAFVFDGLESFARQRLIRYHVPFIVPCRQMYLPMFIADFRERTAGAKQPIKSLKHLSGPAQVLVLFYLQQRNVPTGQSLREWSVLLGYSTMTATRMAGELVQAGLCAVRQVGRRTVLDLDEDRHALWEKALPFLRSPVRDRKHARLLGKDAPVWAKAGITALSDLTMLASDDDLSFAMSATAYARALVDARFRELSFADEDAVTIERWRYRPELVIGDQATTVDRLSLYLSLRDDPDERVQAALNELLEGVQW